MHLDGVNRTNTPIWDPICVKLDTQPTLVRSRAMAAKAPDAATFGHAIAESYATKGGAVELGTGMLDGALVPKATVRLPLATMNRHGLIAGATGTGKTRTLQVIAEQLSAAGVAVFTADVKGDVSGMAVPGSTDGPAKKRATELGLSFTPTGFPVEYLSLGGIGPGVPVRATVSDFGPLLLARVLGSNATQEQSLALVFHYADEKGLPLLDLSDLRALLTFLDSDGGREELRGIGGLSPQTVGVLLRSLVGLETGGGNEFFGEPQLDIADLLRTPPDGRGVISCLELPAVQDKPGLWSTVLMWLVAELFEQLPEVGDRDKPRLVFFLDEAHLLFEGASKAFVESTVQTVRLIRSKGVGVFFVTQMPKDVPADVLGQLGSRVQHALRAFTPDDAKALRATVRTFPKSDAYDLEELLTQLGTGEAAVTILSESGVPTPVVHTRMRPPLSRMGPADDVAGVASAGPLFAKYGTRLDSQSAREMLATRLDPPAPGELPTKPTERQKGAASAAGKGADAIGDFLQSSSGRALTREVVRGVFGMLKKGF
jgi:DNA double-strand break repair helicase HerA and related ATPase